MSLEILYNKSCDRNVIQFDNYIGCFTNSEHEKKFKVSIDKDSIPKYWDLFNKLLELVVPVITENSISLKEVEFNYTGKNNFDSLGTVMYIKNIKINKDTTTPNIEFECFDL